MRTEPVTARRLGVGIIAALAVLTSGCAAGQYAQTSEQKPTLDGTEASIGNIDLRGLSIQAPTSAPYYKAGSAALVKLVVVNNSSKADTLTGISSSAFTGWGAFATAAAAEQAQSAAATPAAASSSSTPAAPTGTGSAATSPGASTPAAPSSSAAPAGSKSVPVPAGARVSWGVPDATGGLLLLSFKKPAYPGTTIPVTFTFADNGSKTIAVPIALTAGANQSVVPGPSATGEFG